MSKRLRINEPFLHLLARSSAKRRKFLLKQATREELASLFKICLNILRDSLPLSPHIHKELKRERNTLRKLADKKISLKQKKMINEKGRISWNHCKHCTSTISSNTIKMKYDIKRVLIPEAEYRKLLPEGGFKAKISKIVKKTVWPLSTNHEATATYTTTKTFKEVTAPKSFSTCISWQSV